MHEISVSSTRINERPSEKIPYQYQGLCLCPHSVPFTPPLWNSDVNKDSTFKAKDKDQTRKDKDQDKDQTPKDKDQTFKAKDQDKD